MKEGDKGEKLVFERSLNSGMTRVGYARVLGSDLESVNWEWG